MSRKSSLDLRRRTALSAIAAVGAAIVLVLILLTKCRESTVIHRPAPVVVEAMEEGSADTIRVEKTSGRRKAKGKTQDDKKKRGPYSRSYLDEEVGQ